MNASLISPGGARKLVDLDQGFAVRLQGKSSSVKKLGSSAKDLSELVRDCGEAIALWSVFRLVVSRPVLCSGAA